MLTIAIHPTSRFEGVTLTRTNTTIFIRDSNTVTVELAPTSVIVLEDEALVNVSVVKVGDTLIPVSVLVSTRNLSARAGLDYEALSMEVVFSAEVTVLNLTIAIIADSTLEMDESFQLVLNSIANQPVTLLRPQATITVLNDDVVVVSLEEENVFVSEDEGSVTLTVIKNGTNDIDITANIATESLGGAIANLDYGPFSLQLVFSPDDINNTVVVTIIDDNVAEVPERFFVVLSSVQVGVEVAEPRRSAIIIVDNDNVEVGFTLSRYVVREDSGELELTLMKAGESRRNVTVQYSTVDGSARAPGDYLELSDVAIFGPDDTFFSFMVVIVNDNRTEPQTSFSVQLLPFGGGVVNAPGRGRAQVDIIDDDAITVGFANATYTASEGDVAVTLTIVKLRPSTVPTIIQYFTTPDSATDDDFIVVAATPLSLAESELSIDVTVQLVDDLLSEGVESFFVQLELIGVQDEVVLSQSRATIFIEDNDGVVVLFEPGLYSVSELAGDAGLRIIRQGVAENNLTFLFSTQDMSASAIDGDYIPVIEELNFAPNEAEKFVSVVILNDNVYEGSEAFFGLLLAISPGVEVIGGPAVVTIEDESDAVVIGFELSEVTVSEEEGFVSINIVKTGDNAVPVQFFVTTMEGSAKESADFAFLSQNFTFGADDVTVSFNVTIHEDGTIENVETFEVVVGAVKGERGVVFSKGSDRLTISITDSTAGLAVLFGDADITIQEETELVTLRIIALGLLETSVTIIFTTQDGTARAGEDYEPTVAVLVFLPGQTQQEVVVPIINDDVVEGEELFLALLISQTNESNLAIPQNTTTIRIQDNDQVVLTFDPVEYNVSESEGTVQLRVVKIGRNVIPVSVSFNTADNSAIGRIVRSDYVPVSEILVFGENDTERIITVEILDNNAVEETERFFGQLAITPGETGVTIATATCAVFIHDDDVVTVGFMRSEYTAREGVSRLLITLVKRGENQVGVVVFFSLVDGSATGGFDFIPDSQSIMFGPRDTEGLGSVQIIDDDLYEGNETFFGLLEIQSNLRGVVVVNSTTEITVIDDDFVFVSFAMAEYVVAEGDVVVNLTINKQGRSAIPVDITIATTSEGLSASENADYIPVNFVLSLEPDETSTIVSITVLDDGRVEGREEFMVELGGGEGVVIVDGTTLVVILDEDAVRIGFEETKYVTSEGNETVQICIAKSAPVDFAFDVQFSTQSDSAEVLTDFLPGDTVLTFGPSDTRLCVSIVIINDDIVERREQFRNEIILLDRSMVEEGTLIASPTVTRVCIEDDDALAIAFEQTSYNVSEGGDSLAVRVTKTGANDVPVEIRVATESLSATGGVDYTELLEELVFERFDFEIEFFVSISRDGIVENDEVFLLLLTAATANQSGQILIAEPSVPVTIVDDDEATFEFSEPFFLSPEATGSVNITVVRLGDSEVPLAVLFRTNNGTAFAPGDYEPVLMELIFEPLDTARQVSVVIVDDAIVEADEVLDIELSAVEGEGRVNLALSAIPSARIVIQDDDVIEVGFEQVEYFVEEGETFVEVALTKLGENERPVSVALSTQDGAAIGFLDYLPVFSSMVTFQSGQSIVIATISLRNDDTVESDEDFFVQLSTSVGEVAAVITDQDTATVTITDDDSIRIGFTILEYSVLEGESFVVAVVKQEGSADRNVTVAVASVDITANAPSDYTAIASNLTFVPEELVQTVTVDIHVDLVAEATETFSLQLSNPLNDRAVVLGENADFTILDQDDVVIGFEVPSVSVAEDADGVVVSVVLTGEADVSVTVQYSTSDVSALSGEDYEEREGSITFTPGTSRQSFTIEIINDRVLEQIESFEIVLELPPESRRTVLLENNRLTVEIQDNDNVVLELTEADFVATEDEGSVEVCVQRLGATAVDLDVAIRSKETVPASAIGNVDFDLVILNVTFPSTDANPSAEQCVSIPIQDDEIALEGEEMFEVELTVLSQLAGVQQGTFIATVSIQDNDLFVEVVFEQDSYVVSEDTSMVEVCVRKNVTTAQTISVVIETHETIPVSATGNQDFRLASITINLESSTNIACANVAILNDETFEDEQYFIVRFSPKASSGENGVIFRTTQPPVITIVDDEVLQVRGDDVIASEENGTATVCLQLDRETEIPVTLTLIFAGVENSSTANVGVDFDGAVNTVIFEPGFLESCVDIPIFADELVEGSEYFCVNIVSNSSRIQASSTRELCDILITIEDAGVPLPPICRVEDAILITPFQRTAPGDLNFNFHGSCEHILLSSCNINPSDFAITADFISSNLDMGRIGIRLSEIRIIINKDLSITSENLGEPISSDDSTTVYEDGVTITQNDSETLILITTLGVHLTRTRLPTGDNFVFINVSEEGSLVEVCGLCGTLEGVLLHSDRDTEARIENRTQIERFADSWRVNPGEQFLRQQRSECGFVGTDTIVGDPLFAVTLYDVNSSTPILRNAGNSTPPALCFEIHGSTNQIFNLVSDACTSVNALYTAMDVAENGNIISAIGIRAINKLGDCIDVLVDLENDCMPVVSYANVSQSVERYSASGVSVSLHRERVRVSVPNCENVQLVMWMICKEVRGQRLIDFEITRGVNLRPTSHGLLGQFWNIPISFEKFTYNGTDPAVADTFSLNRLYEITVSPVGGAPPRTFIGELYHKAWQKRGVRCYYAGTSQGGALKEFSGSATDTVIQGSYREYRVDELYESEFTYSRFDKETCS